MSEKVTIKKEDVGVLKVGFKDVNVNPGPKKKAERNLSRIARLNSILASRPADWPRRESFERELKRRTLEAQVEALKGGK